MKPSLPLMFFLPVADPGIAGGGSLGKMSENLRGDFLTHTVHYRKSVQLDDT